MLDLERYSIDIVFVQVLEVRFRRIVAGFGKLDACRCLSVGHDGRKLVLGQQKTAALNAHRPRLHRRLRHGLAIGRYDFENKLDFDVRVGIVICFRILSCLLRVGHGRRSSSALSELNPGQ